jgi:elongation of very long chain fatty acids protein 4
VRNMEVDHRVEDWPLMQSPIPTVAISVSYIIISVVAPKLLQGRTIPVYYPVLIYNFLIVLLNMYMVIELFVTTRNYNWQCQEMDTSDDEYSLRTANVLWWYYFSKVIEMMDTMFFICKGNYRQLSFLHIYHHSTMFVLWWFGVKYVPGGNSVLGALINCCVHVVMYSYYFLAAFGPRFKEYLWWKKYITKMQLTQFFIALVHSIVSYRTGCKWPMWMHYTLNGYLVSFLILFGNFYMVNYINQKPSVEQKKMQ